MIRKFFKILFLAMLVTIVQSCPDDDDSMMQEPVIEDITAELQYFIFTPAEENVPERLQYEVLFENPNDVGVLGFYRVTTIAYFGDESIESTSLSFDNSPGNEIQSNSSCTITFDVTGDLNFGSPDLIEFVSASYTIDSTF